MAEKETLRRLEAWEKRQKFIDDSLEIAKKYRIYIRPQAYEMFTTELGVTFMREAEKHYSLIDC